MRQLTSMHIKANTGNEHFSPDMPFASEAHNETVLLNLLAYCRTGAELVMFFSFRRLIVTVADLLVLFTLACFQLLPELPF